MIRVRKWRARGSIYFTIGKRNGVRRGSLNKYGPFYFSTKVSSYWIKIQHAWLRSAFAGSSIKMVGNSNNKWNGTERNGTELNAAIMDYTFCKTCIIIRTSWRGRFAFGLLLWLLLFQRMHKTFHRWTFLFIFPFRALGNCIQQVKLTISYYCS